MPRKFRLCYADGSDTLLDIDAIDVIEGDLFAVVRDGGHRLVARSGSWTACYALARNGRQPEAAILSGRARPAPKIWGAMSTTVVTFFERDPVMLSLAVDDLYLDDADTLVLAAPKADGFPTGWIHTAFAWTAWRSASDLFGHLEPIINATLVSGAAETATLIAEAEGMHWIAGMFGKRLNVPTAPAIAARTFVELDASQRAAGTHHPDAFVADALSCACLWRDAGDNRDRLADIAAHAQEAASVSLLLAGSECLSGLDPAVHARAADLARAEARSIHDLWFVSSMTAEGACDEADALERIAFVQGKAWALHHLGCWRYADTIDPKIRAAISSEAAYLDARMRDGRVVPAPWAVRERAVLARNAQTLIELALSGIGRADLRQNLLELVASWRDPHADTLTKDVDPFALEDPLDRIAEHLEVTITPEEAELIDDEMAQLGVSGAEQLLRNRAIERFGLTLESLQAAVCAVRDQIQALRFAENALATLRPTG
ncbi:hypothetical protein [Rhodovibrio sodomensis]|uniref:hypothetical protein n=1 Tax=Rhodovibrio sodomensis TaxID=1088 RepID=UPI001908D49F|nr:hypothetical protein [Rhodovibrio sodomensis]